MRARAKRTTVELSHTHTHTLTHSSKNLRADERRRRRRRWRRTRETLAGTNDSYGPDVNDRLARTRPFGDGKRDRSAMATAAEPSSVTPLAMTKYDTSRTTAGLRNHICRVGVDTVR